MIGVKWRRESPAPRSQAAVPRTQGRARRRAAARQRIAVLHSRPRGEGARGGGRDILAVQVRHRHLVGHRRVADRAHGARHRRRRRGHHHAVHVFRHRRNHRARRRAAGIRRHRVRDTFNISPRGHREIHRRRTARRATARCSIAPPAAACAPSCRCTCTARWPTWTRIMAIAARHGSAVIEDAAQAIGAEDAQGRRACSHRRHRLPVVLSDQEPRRVRRRRRCA